KMGIALAEAAARMGADVTLVLGPSSLKPWSAVRTINVTTAADMFDAVEARRAEQDVFILAAAVSDYTPAAPAPQKLKKNEDGLHIDFVRTIDILQHLGENIAPHQTLVGFALETENELANAIDKLKRKNLDIIVLNSLNDAQSGFGYDTN